MKDGKKRVVLYGVLNWGLGHATRSVPIIQALIDQGFSPVIASDGQALTYLKSVFPELPAEILPAYNIRYGKGSSQLLKLAQQLPRVFFTSRKEHQILKALVRKYNACGVISDNRLGWYSDKVSSVYITHQLKLIMPFNTNFASFLHHRFINRYSECWVPDWEGANNLSGDLGHDLKPKISTRYLGPQSRFDSIQVQGTQEKKYDLAIILSGPEPQRSLLEEKLLEQLPQIEGKFLFIRGSKGLKTITSSPNMEVVDLANSDQVADAILNSHMTISRSGYSSIMDYYFLGNQALLIPTPGQPEQEYLARYQLHKGRFGYAAQNYLNLKDDLIKAREYSGFSSTKTKKASWQELFGLFESKGKS